MNALHFLAVAVMMSGAAVVLLAVQFAEVLLKSRDRRLFLIAGILIGAVAYCLGTLGVGIAIADDANKFRASTLNQTP